jgi:hypothetical protein
MAKRKKDDDDGLVTVRLACGFRHNGTFYPTGSVIRMEPAEAADMQALNMARIVQPEAAA